MNHVKRMHFVSSIRRLMPAARVVPLLLTSLALPSSAWAQAEAPWMILAGPQQGYVEVPHDPTLNPEQITVEAWTYLTSGLTYGGDDCPSLVGKAYTQAYWLGVCGNRLRFYTHGSGSSLDSLGQIPTREWVHVAVTYDGSDLRFYINGSLDSEFGHDLGPMTASTAPLRIGSDVNWAVSPHGAIDEVRVWNVARTEAEVASTMNLAISTPTPGLVAAWNLDGDAADSVGGHDGATFGEVSFGNSVPEPNPCIREYFVPAAAHAAGALGSQWVTDMSVLNWNDTSTAVELFLLPRDSDNSDAVHVSFAVGPHQSRFLPDVVLSEFGESNMAAAFRICSTKSLQVDTRTYNSPPGSAGGTFGQGVPGESADTASDSPGWLIGLYENGQFRTNVGFVNATAAATTVQLRFYEQDGTLLGSTEYQLPPYGHRQRNRVWREITEKTVENGMIYVWSSDADILAYASVVDNTTGDDTYKRARY